MAPRENSPLQSPVVAFDIEVAGLEWEEVDEATRHYLMARAKTEEDKEAVEVDGGIGGAIALLYCDC